MVRNQHDVVVVGGGVAGCFAAATAAVEGVDVVQLERKSRQKGGFIACGDAMKSPRDPSNYPGPIDMDAIASDEAVLVDSNIDRIEFWDDAVGVRKVLPYEDGSNVVDRYEFGQRLLEQAADLGVEQHYDTVVNEVVQNGRVTGVKAIRDGEPVTYGCDVLIDAAGAQSILQDMVGFESLDTPGDPTFEVPQYTHFGSAYREIIETDEPVEYHDAIVGKPLEELGYIWYFPRTPTEINVGLGFQMNKEPIPLVDRLRRDVETRPEYQKAAVAEKFDGKNKLGSAIALRRPLDSMVAPGYLAAGGAAGTTHPITGKGIRGAAYSGYSAGRAAVEAIEDGDFSEHGLWEHNRWLYREHGEAAKLASWDAYNVAANSIDVNVLRALTALLPEKEIRGIVGTSTEVDDLKSKLFVGAGLARNALSEFRAGTFDTLGVSKSELYDAIRSVGQTRDHVTAYERQYEAYPEDRSGFESWLSDRNRIDRDFYDALDLSTDEQKY
ncbi:NAD(P)/FAD-dependent oxidoreductase [Natronobacterium gregoryi]|uniref:FAD-dependent oxidoreductase n=2 Tax=Natronobacterium gregoryi TaxID=44930 RepID=L0AMF6_NATGS|nr:geranylgeranyl reductase family protein [Natronobacterium gregoryi]AFZ74235.1 geranylgeranyl reductase family protein [Natronobacterium gregoryi SP2]ELY63691.1 geranylgeranyl reductase [Natronobacterium gregoryi SP2]PLK21979.1 FAD-dependent oxidoreductase [Natronobacterium gregoryi SP2]SFI52001.1 geranylgeranyl reductase family [Natronobacterium gregoryi]